MSSLQCSPLKRLQSVVFYAIIIVFVLYSVVVLYCCDNYFVNMHALKLFSPEATISVKNASNVV